MCARSLILLKCVAMQISSSALQAYGVAVVVDVLVAAAVGEQFVYCSSTATLQRVGHADMKQNKSGLECSRPPPSFAAGLALLLFPPTQIRIAALNLYARACCAGARRDSRCVFAT